MRERIRVIIVLTCAEMGVHIVQGVLGRDHVHMFLSIPPKLALSNVRQRIKGRSSRRIQMKFPELRKRYWGRRFWARGYFSTTSGNVTDDIITQYLELHSSKRCYRRQPEVVHFLYLLGPSTSGVTPQIFSNLFTEWINLEAI